MSSTILQAILLLCFLLNLTEAQTKTKRQIYREQVLPHSGGKIPEDAFRADRLALNRLNKEGIAIPDGILLEHRHVHSHPHRNKFDPEDEDSVIKIFQQTEHRYTPEEGRYHDETPETVASTYLIRKPIGREESNILTPDQQRPLHEAIRYKQEGRHPAHYGQQQYHQPTAPAYQHQPQMYQQYTHVPSYPRYDAQQHKPQVYHPLPVPFELPNKEIQQEQYYLKEYQNSYPTSDDITSRIEWPLLYNNNYDEKYSQELNNLLSSDYDFQAPLYHPSEPISHLTDYRNFYSTFNDRFIRKSQEGYVGGSRKSSKSILPSSNRRVFSDSKTIKCKDGSKTKCKVSK